MDFERQESNYSLEDPRFMPRAIPKFTFNPVEFANAEVFSKRIARATEGASEPITNENKEPEHCWLVLQRRSCVVVITA